MAGSRHRRDPRPRTASPPRKRNSPVRRRSTPSGHSIPPPGIPPAATILPRSFYTRATLRVARDLLGKYFVRVDRKKLLAGRIVEVEAYLGGADPASHAFRGRTRRNETMFREGGVLYVYFTYGMHYCANVVTGRPGTGSAVLIRALEPVAGLTRMARYRKLKTTSRSPRVLTGGPARLCQAMRIDGKQDGTDLRGPEVYIMEDVETVPFEIGTSRRVGIRAGTEKPWRFFIRGNLFVSRGEV